MAIALEEAKLERTGLSTEELAAIGVLAEEPATTELAETLLSATDTAEDSSTGDNVNIGGA